MLKKIHPIAALIATVCIATFFTSSIFVELLGSAEWVAKVKQLIVMPGLFILVPAMAISGATGFALSKERKGRLVKGKKKRMPIIGLNGILILIPCAIILNQWAASASFDTKFYLVQGLELLAGAVNLGLMTLNIRDGRKLSKRSTAN